MLYTAPIHPITPMMPEIKAMDQHRHHMAEKAAGRFMLSHNRQGRTNVVGVTQMAPMRPRRSPKKGIMRPMKHVEQMYKISMIWRRRAGPMRYNTRPSIYGLVANVGLGISSSATAS